MKFSAFNDETRDQFDAYTQSVMTKLANAYGSVEFREIIETNEWCVRVKIVDEMGEGLPLAALGDTPRDAAERMVRICGLDSQWS